MAHDVNVPVGAALSFTPRRPSVSSLDGLVMREVCRAHALVVWCRPGAQVPSCGACERSKRKLTAAEQQLFKKVQKMDFSGGEVHR